MSGLQRDENCDCAVRILHGCASSGMRCLCAHACTLSVFMITVDCAIKRTLVSWVRSDSDMCPGLCLLSPLKGLQHCGQTASAFDRLQDCGQMKGPLMLKSFAADRPHGLLLRPNLPQRIFT